MASSLQEQLLKAGLVTQQKAKQTKTDKRKDAKARGQAPDPAADISGSSGSGRVDRVHPDPVGGLLSPDSAVGSRTLEAGLGPGREPEQVREKHGCVAFRRFRHGKCRYTSFRGRPRDG